MTKNIIWICSDQQRADSLGCMGNRYAKTPHLDGLAAKGALLKRLISAHPVCMPSRAAMLTASHPTRNGVISNGIPLAERDPFDHERKSHVPTIAHHLAEQGYHTRCIGKLHLQPHQAALEHQFRESYAMWASGANDTWAGPLYGFEHLELSETHGADVGGAYYRWLEQYNPQAAASLRDRQQWGEKPCSLGDLQGAAIPADCSTTMWIAHRFADFMQERQQQNEGQPFFCWLGFPDPHHPWQPPQELVEEFKDAAVMPAVAEQKQGASSAWQKISGDSNDLSKREDYQQCVELVRRFTDAQNALIDRAVGNIIASLEAAGIADDTIICFTSDHGDYLGDYGRVRKNGFSGVCLNRVPGIVYDPAGSIRGEQAGVCGHVDLAPTLCQAAGVPWDSKDGTALQHGFPGRAMVPCVQRCDDMNISWWTDNERYTYFPNIDEEEYYLHNDDAAELKNCAAEHPQRCQQLRQQLFKEYIASSSHDVARYSAW